MLKMNFPAILSWMHSQKYAAELEQKEQQICASVKAGEREYPLFVRICDEGHLLQILVFFPLQIPKGQIGDMARLLHLFNKELDLPGFGMDEAEGIVFYRLLIPTPAKQVDEDLFSAFLKTVQHVCDLFIHPIGMVCSGQFTLDEILEKAALDSKNNAT